MFTPASFTSCPRRWCSTLTSQDSVSALLSKTNRITKGKSQHLETKREEKKRKANENQGEVERETEPKPNRNRFLLVLFFSTVANCLFRGREETGGGEGAPGNIICQVHDKLNRIWTETASKPICVNCCLKGEEAQGAERNEVGELNRANMQMNLLTWIFAQQILIFHYERQGGGGKEIETEMEPKPVSLSLNHGGRFSAILLTQIYNYFICTCVLLLYNYKCCSIIEMLHHTFVFKTFSVLSTWLCLSVLNFLQQFQIISLDMIFVFGMKFRPFYCQYR